LVKSENLFQDPRVFTTIIAVKTILHLTNG
jgi:hypothetical protein